MPLRFTQRSLSVRITLAALALALTAGCSRTVPPFLFDPARSVNIALINPAWPKTFEDLTPAQREVMIKRRRPEFAHIQWSSYHDIMDRALAVQNMQNTGQKPEKMPFAWVYPDAKEEVIFPDATSSKVRPLSDGILAILEYGDPDQTRMLSNNKGVRTEVWSYINQGVVLTFENGKRVKTNDSSIPAMKNYLNQ